MLLAMQWWADETFTVMDPYGYVAWYYRTVSQPKPPEGAKMA